MTMPRLQGIREYITTTFDKILVVPKETISMPLLEQVVEATTILTGICIARPSLGLPLKETTVQIYYNDKIVTDPLPLFLLDPPLVLPSPIRVNEKEQWRLAIKFAEPLSEDLRLYVAVIGARSREVV
jgi:hypothetical protein